LPLGESRWHRKNIVDFSLGVGNAARCQSVTLWSFGAKPTERGLYMHFGIDGCSGFKSPRLPRSVEMAMRSLVQSGGIVSIEALSQLTKPQDSNLDVVAEIMGHEVVADGSIVLQAVIDGLKRRLDTVVESNEKIRLVGG
jgi:hypothetical protein